MSEVQIFAKARTYEGTDPSNDIPAVVALTQLEVAAFARAIRSEALEQFCVMLWDVRRTTGCISSDTVGEIQDAIRALARESGEQA